MIANTHDMTWYLWWLKGQITFLLIRCGVWLVYAGEQLIMYWYIALSVPVTGQTQDLDLGTGQHQLATTDQLGETNQTSATFDN